MKVINAACMVVSVEGSAMHLQVSRFWALFEEWCVQLLTPTDEPVRPMESTLEPGSLHSLFHYP